MNSKTINERDLRQLVLQWKKRGKEYEAAMEEENPPDRHRYEGIYTAMRWCYEDLESLLKENSNG